MANTFKIRDKETGEVFTVREKSQNTLKGDIPAITSEAVSGALADAPRSAPRNPLRTALSGLPGLQASQGANIIPSIQNFLGANKEPPFPDEKRQLPQILPEAKTETGKALGLGANIIGGFFGAPGKSALKTLDAGADLVASNIAGPNKVKKIQKAFFPFQKEATKAFGRALRVAKKGEDLPSFGAKESEAILAPLREISPDIQKFIPRKAIEVGKFVNKPGKGGATARNLNVNDLLIKKAQLRKILSVAERNGKIVTEQSKVINSAINNIDKAMLDKIPGLEKANKAYASFIRAKSFLEKFEPRFANLDGFIGTSEGEKYLRNIANLTTEEIKTLKAFERASNINIVGAAKTADTTKRMASIVKKMAALSVTIGALKAAGADKLFFQAADVAN